ncbi:hypothetical protein J6590_102372, partial [Homalodisca vitripennis]
EKRFRSQFKTGKTVRNSHIKFQTEVRLSQCDKIFIGSNQPWNPHQTEQHGELADTVVCGVR